ncbi:helix-turn-helix domain-containing protein [Streptomyces sp. NPDC057616]|uniref:helix-turn-helix domain-containing protein n=1 Tax=Streptomyces sp. NPDC057616 TaxID=3346183 RepID=UPI0036A342F7
MSTRYRLRRYEELTGTSPDAPDTAVELSWALAASEPERSRGTSVTEYRVVSIGGEADD